MLLYWFLITEHLIAIGAYTIAAKLAYGPCGPYADKDRPLMLQSGYG